MNQIGTTYFRASKLSYLDLYLERKNDFLVINMIFFTLMTCPLVKHTHLLFLLMLIIIGVYIL